MRINILISICLMTSYSCSDLLLHDMGHEEQHIDGGFQSVSPLTFLSQDGNELSELPGNFGRYQLAISSDKKWQIKSSDSFVRLEKESGEGNDTIWLMVGCNWSTDRIARLELLEGSDTEDNVFLSRVTSVNLVQKQGNAYGTIIDKVNSSLGAGYSYKPNNSYCMGSGIQIFNMSNFQTIQQEYGCQLMIDDYYPSITTSFFSSDSLETLQTDLSLGVSVDVELKLFSVNIQGNFQNSNISNGSRTYAVQRLVSSQFTRELHYMNALGLMQENPQLNDRLFTAGFKMLKDELIYNIHHSQNEETREALCASFVKQVGPCFITKSVMGCGMDYYISSEKNRVTDSIGVEAILAFKWDSVIKVDVNAEGHYSSEERQALESTSDRFDIRGGNLEKVSILNSGGTLPYDIFQQWLIDFVPEKAVLVDIKLEPIYLLFTDELTRKSLRSYLQHFK